jgi:hypothetical protein
MDKMYEWPWIGYAERIVSTFALTVNLILFRKEQTVGHLDYLFRDQHDDQFQQGIQTDLDMLLLEKMHENARREGRLRGGKSQGHATSGWKNRGFMFWVVLVFMVYWFILRPLGL